MASCKDCFHYELCKRIDYELEYHNKSIKEAEEELPIKCRFFKNKADIQEIKHGKWKKHTDDGDCDYIECSACGEEFYPPNNEFTFDVIPKYCQNCGAKMGGG